MPQQGYSIGRDCTVSVTLPGGGGTLRLGKVLSFDCKQALATQTIKPLDGRTAHLAFRDGDWSGSFKIERRGPELDVYFAGLEANYRAGLEEPPVAIQQTILEPGGAVSQFRFEGALLTFENAGEWAADKSISQSISFVAARRIKQA